MKLNILYDQSDVRSGWANVSPLAGPTMPGVARASLSNLDHVVKDAGADEIVAIGVLDHVGPAHLDDVLDHWVRKVRLGGTLTLGGTDLPELCRLVASGQLDVVSANAILFGRPDRPLDVKRSALSLSILVERLEAKGLKVVSRGYRGSDLWVTAKRSPSN